MVWKNNTNLINQALCDVTKMPLLSRLNFGFFKAGGLTVDFRRSPVYHRSMLLTMAPSSNDSKTLHPSRRRLSFKSLFRFSLDVSAL